jgi:hypothetical protein
MKMALKCKNNEFFDTPLKNVLSGMGLVNHPGTQKLWAVVTKIAINAKTMSFWSCLLNMYRVLWAM